MKKKASKLKIGQYIAYEGHFFRIRALKHVVTGKHGHAKVKLDLVQLF